MFRMINGKKVKMTKAQDKAHKADQDRLSKPSTNPQDYILTPRQFNHMAALAGYDDAIDAILAALKSGNRALYAEIKSGVVGSASFHFDKVQAIITNPAVAPLIPNGVDVTKTTLTTNWLAAKDY